MTTHIIPFSNLTHQDSPYDEATGTQLLRTRITRRYTGDADGEGAAELLLCKTPNGVMSYAGTDRFAGKLRGGAGTFVYQHAGVLEKGHFEGFGFIVPGSATGELTGLRGRATVKVGPAGEHALHLEVEE